MHQDAAGNARPCEQTRRDERKAVDRWAVKAKDTIRRHAVRHGIDKTDLVNVYGWDPARLAHDAKHQYGSGCSYCGLQYQTMGKIIAATANTTSAPAVDPVGCCARSHPDHRPLPRSHHSV
jgi:hypothetical protein